MLMLGGVKMRTRSAIVSSRTLSCEAADWKERHKSKDNYSGGKPLQSTERALQSRIVSSFIPDRPGLFCSAPRLAGWLAQNHQTAMHGGERESFIIKTSARTLVILIKGILRGFLASSPSAGCLYCY